VKGLDNLRGLLFTRGMNSTLGRILCFCLGKHKWRRLRKGETAPLLGGTVEGPQTRICRRCGATKLVNSRQHKAAP